MATNKFKPFATSPDANVMTDEQLASAEELSIGFKLKSKADSKLIGKLIQDTSAAAYAIGEFVVNNGGTNDVTGTNATQLAQDFDKAVKSVVTGSSGNFVTSEQLTEKLEPITTSLEQKADADDVTSQLASKADTSALANYAPIANPAFTGTITVGGKTVATTEDVAAVEVDLSNYTGDVSLTQGTSTFKVNSSGVSVKSAGFNGGTETPFSSVALKSEIPTDVLTKTEAGTTYLTQQNATTTYATKSELTAKADASNVYSKQDADLKFATKGEIPTDYLSTTGGTIEGDLTVTGTINATIEGTTENATKLATPRNITITGGVTGASTAGFDGSADVTINVTSIAGANVTGVVGEATKATQDGQGRVIADTYATKADLGSVLEYKGSVANQSNLPEEAEKGDVYNVQDTGKNFAWDGTQWDDLGGTVDFSGYLTTANASSTYLSKSDASSTYATKSELGTKADSSALGNYVTTSTANSTYATITALNSKADQSALANYLTTAAAGTTYATKTELANKLDNTKDAVEHVLISTGNINLISSASGNSYTLNKIYQNLTESFGGISITNGSDNTSSIRIGAQNLDNSRTVISIDSSPTGDEIRYDEAITIRAMSNAETAKSATIQLYSDPNKSGIEITGNTKFWSSVTLYEEPKEDSNPATKKYVDSNLASYLTTANAGATYATKTELNTKAEASALANYAPLASPALTGTPTVNGVGIADDNDVAAKINLTGSRGQLAGYEAVSSVAAVTINGDSADSIEASGNVTVSDGSAGQCWTKVVHITASTPNVQLGSAWHWQNGSNPEMKTGGFLVLCWCSTAGLAIYNNVG